MLAELSFVLPTSSGDEIRGDLRYSRGGTGLPVLLLCHGFTAHKDWGPFPHIGCRFAELGFASIIFNFSHNGMGPDFRRFTEREKFSKNTIGKELEDVRSVVDALGDGRLGEGIIDAARTGILGHSRGGGVAILSARLDPRLKGVAAWSSVATFHRYTPRQKQVWEEQGFLPVTIRGSKTNLRYGIEVLRDLETNREQYDLPAAVKNLRVPLLLVHGSADVSVSPREPEELYAAADKSKTDYVLLEGAGHTFGAAHPYRGVNPTVDHVVDLTARWFHPFL
jgi:dipeptidyl aminopeptidase/acylaminoacyl peptidase